MTLLNDGCVTKNCSAVRLKFSEVVSARKMRNCRGEIFILWIDEYIEQKNFTDQSRLPTIRQGEVDRVLQASCAVPPGKETLC